MRKNRKAKWAAFMNFVEWEGITSWEDINDRRYSSSYLSFKTWLTAHRKYLSQEVLTGFDTFFAEDDAKTSWVYTLKDRATEAYRALYMREQDEIRN